MSLTLDDMEWVVDAWKLTFGRNLITGDKGAKLLLEDCSRYCSQGDQLREWLGEFRQLHPHGLPTWAEFMFYMKEKSGGGRPGYYRPPEDRCFYCDDSGSFPVAAVMVKGKVDVRSLPPAAATGGAYAFVVACFCSRGQKRAAPDGTWRKVRDAWRAHYECQTGRASDARDAWVRASWERQTAARSPEPGGTAQPSAVADAAGADMPF